MNLKLKDNPELKLRITQLEYIESTGTQYIDTGFNFDSNVERLELKLQNLGNDYPTFGANSRGSECMLCYNGSITYVSGTSVNAAFVAGFNDVIMGFVPNAQILTVNNTNYNVVSSRNANGKKIYLFGIIRTADGYTIDQYRRLRISYFSITKNNQLLIELIPAKDNNNIVCMYDTVSEQFFYNQGTGDFVAGPTVKQGLPENILLNITTLYHKNTPNINGLQLLNSILNAQETAEDVVLNRIRVDIGNVSGSLSELMQYVGMAGFNDNYEPQTKPRLVGTWTVNDWYTAAQLAQAQAAFDGLTIVGDPNYVIDFNELAVQCLDDTQPNYNPAVAIILQAEGYGNTLSEPPIQGQVGRWFITKAQASAITSVDLFAGKTTVTDNIGIVSSDTTTTYDFEYFNEFEYFGCTNGSSIFYNCSKLKEITIPSTLTSISGSAFWGIHLTKFKLSSTHQGGAFVDIWKTWYNADIDEFHAYNTSQLQHTALGTNDERGIVPHKCFVNGVELKTFTTASDISDIGHWHIYGQSMNKIICDNYTTYVNVSNADIKTVGLIGSDCDLELGNAVSYLAIPGRKITQITIPNTVTTLGYGFLSQNTNNLNIEIPASVTTTPDYFLYQSNANVTILGTVNFGGSWHSFYGHSGWLHLYQSTPPSMPNWGNDFSTPHIYVGDGSSAAHDDAILQTYLANSTWATYSSRLDTWYNYLHPQS